MFSVTCYYMYMYMYMDTQTLIQIHVCTCMYTCSIHMYIVYISVHVHVCICMCTFAPFSWYLHCMRPATGTVQEPLWHGNKPGGRYVQRLERFGRDCVHIEQIELFYSTFLLLETEFHFYFNQRLKSQNRKYHKVNIIRLNTWLYSNSKTYTCISYWVTVSTCI